MILGGLIANINNKWNETLKRIETLNSEISLKEEYIKNALEKEMKSLNGHKR